MPRRGNSKRQATVRKIQDPDDNCGSKKGTRPPKKVNNQSSDGIVKLKDAEIDPATDKSKKNRKRKMVEVEVSKQVKTAKKSNLPCETNATQQDQPNYAMIDISKLAIIIGACYVKWKLYMEKEGKTTDEQFAEFLLSIYERHMSVCVKDRRTNTIETENEPLHGENCTRLPIEEIVNKKDISTQTQEEPQDEECTWSRHIIKEDTSEIEQYSQAECYSEDATKTEIATEIQPRTVKDVHQCSGSLVHNIATKECSKVRDLTETVCATQTIVKQDDLLNSNENANAQILATQVNSETGNMELEPDLMHLTPREDPICSIESVKSLSSVCQQIGKVDSDRNVDSAVDDDHEIPGTDAEIETSTAIQIEPKTMENDVKSSDAKRTTPCCIKNRNIKGHVETEVLFKPASATKTTAVDQNVFNPLSDTTKLYLSFLTNPVNGPVLTSMVTQPTAGQLKTTQTYPLLLPASVPVQTNHHHDHVNKSASANVSHSGNYNTENAQDVETPPHTTNMETPRTTRYRHKKWKALGYKSKVVRTKCFNSCSVCSLPKTAKYGHSCRNGYTYCPQNRKGQTLEEWNKDILIKNSLKPKSRAPMRLAIKPAYQSVSSECPQIGKIYTGNNVDPGMHHDHKIAAYGQIKRNAAETETSAMVQMKSRTMEDAAPSSDADASNHVQNLAHKENIETKTQCATKTNIVVPNATLPDPTPLTLAFITNSVNGPLLTYMVSQPTAGQVKPALKPARKYPLLLPATGNSTSNPTTSVPVKTTHHHELVNKSAPAKVFHQDNCDPTHVPDVGTPSHKTISETPRTTLYRHKKWKALGYKSNYVRSKCFNSCSVCTLPKTAKYGHSCHRGYVYCPKNLKGQTLEEWKKDIMNKKKPKAH